MKLLTLAVSAGAALTALVGFTLPNGVDDYVAKMHDANSLIVKFKVGRGGGKDEEWSLSYSSPNRFRIESQDSVTVSNGQTLTVLDKRSHTYTEDPANTKPTLTDEVWAWKAFFSDHAFKDATNVTDGGAVTVSGLPFHAWVMSLPKNKTATLYIDPNSGIAFGSKVVSGTDTTSVLATEVKTTSDRLPETTFALDLGGAKKVDHPLAELGSYAAADQVFQQFCTGCHRADSKAGGLDLTSYDAVMEGGNSGKLVQPNDPDNSLLLQRMNGSTPPRMPKGGDALSADKIQAVEEWIRKGAPRP